jgi:hypothetical protein
MMPSVLNGAKAADAARFPARPLFRAMVASVGVGLVVSAAASLALPYYNGGGNTLANSWHYQWPVQQPLQYLSAAASVPYVGSWTSGLHIAGGFLGVLGLFLLRAGTGFGLHPIGFLGASAYAVYVLWFSIFVGWLLKVIAQRYGGMKGFQTMLPFFLGLIVGDVLNAVAWIVLGHITGTGYNVLPA